MKVLILTSMIVLLLIIKCEQFRAFIITVQAVATGCFFQLFRLIFFLSSFGSRDQHGVLQNECKIQNLIHFLFTKQSNKINIDVI